MRKFAQEVRTAAKLATTAHNAGLHGSPHIITAVLTRENGFAVRQPLEHRGKRLRRRGNSVALEPANQRHEIRIFPADRVKVQGSLVALLRRY